MTQAIIKMLREFGEQFDPAQDTKALPFAERFAAYWNGLSQAIRHDSLSAIAGFENAAVAARVPELRSIIAAGQQQARTEIGADYTNGAADLNTQRIVGSLMLAVSTGLIAQLIMDANQAPSGEEIVTAFRYLGNALAET